MSNMTYSQIIFGFMLAYTIMNGASGPIIDRLGTRAGYAFTMAWWSAAAMLHALARGPLSLGIGRFLLGMGEAGNWPAGVKVVAEWFPAEERAFASGIFNSGSSVGAILAPPLVVWIVLKFRWQYAFLFVGAAGFVWLLCWLTIYHTPVEVERPQAASRIPILKLLRTRFVWAFTLSKIFIDPVWYFYIFWFPEYLKRVRHFDMAAIGKYAWIPFFVAAVGNLLGGGLSALLIRRGVSLSVARKSAVTVFAVLMMSAIPIATVADVRLSIALVSLAMVGYTGAGANILAFPADVFPKDVVASVYGFSSLGSGFGGMIFALATGWVIDHYSYVPVFIGFGLLPLVCTAVIWFLLGPISPVSAKSALAESA
jgi:ACS family hexuronate transporter-like MFS transporter